ncbi:MAG: helicase, partial [Acidobacteria bacterium]
MLDNKSLGNVVSELKGNISDGSTLSVVSALFSLYAYDELKKELSKVSKFRLLVPSHGDEEGFIKNLPGNNLDRRLRSRLDVTRIARECAGWLKQKCEVRELPSAVHQNLIHLSHTDSDAQLAIVGSSSFTTDGLGIVPSESHHMNTCFRSCDEARSLIKWFDELWA